MLVRTMTVSDPRAALADSADWRPVAIEIEGDHGTATSDLDDVLERSSLEDGQVRLVLSGTRHSAGRNDHLWPTGPTRRARYQGTRNV